MYFYGFVIQEFGNKVLSVEHKLLAVVGCAQSTFYYIGLKNWSISTRRIGKKQLTN